jgi:hypothetical protein
MAQNRHLSRNTKILEERSKGRTLADIGLEFGVSRETVRRLQCFAERHKKNMQSPIWYARLSPRAKNVLENYKLTDRADALLAFSSTPNLKCANAGVVTMSEIKAALGVV